ncbi:MAG TPA: vWA domain-containing protein, partial [Blastocatellia bacterium]|nr:vWA domain-containing protein [Blastocatellia bacterium]
MKIELTNPLALVLLGLIPLVLYLARNSLAALSKRRRAASIAVRIAIILLVVLALAGLRLNSSSNDLALIFVIDVSASVAPSEQREVIAFINEEIDRAGPRDYIGVVAFGREALVEVSPTRKEVLNDWRLSEISSTPARDYTNIAGALRLAAALVPEAAAGRLVLISDGNENLESALEEARVLKAGGLEVFARSMRALNESGAEKGEVAVRELAVPEMPAEAEAFDLKTTIDTTRDTDAILRVFRNDAVIAERSVRLSADAENVFVLPQRLDEKGFYTYRAEIESTEDGFLQNNSRDAFSLVEGRPRILYIHGDDGASAGLKRVLTEASLAADIRRAAGIPKS